MERKGIVQSIEYREHEYYSILVPDGSGSGVQFVFKPDRFIVVSTIFLAQNCAVRRPCKLKRSCRLTLAQISNPQSLLSANIPRACLRCEWRA